MREPKNHPPGWHDVIRPVPGELKYTPRQQAVILQTIALRMETLHKLLVEVQSEVEGYSSAVLIDAAEIIATHVGAMADAASGCEAVGTPERWCFGTAFAEGGAA